MWVSVAHDRFHIVTDLQDSRTGLLYFADIDLNTVYVYQPSSDKYGYTHFEKNVTAIALLDSGEGVSVQL